MSDKGAACTAFPFSACSWAPGCAPAGASYLYSVGAGPLDKIARERPWPGGEHRMKAGRLRKSLSHIGGLRNPSPRPLSPVSRGARLPSKRRCAPLQSRCYKKATGGGGGKLLSAARTRRKRKGVPFGYAPLGLPPSVVPKG